VVKTIWNTKYN